MAAPIPTKNSIQSIQAFLSRLVTWDRLLTAAIAGSAMSLGLMIAGALHPGLPQSAILAQRTVPFFEHMIASAYVFLLALLGGEPLAEVCRHYPRAAALSIPVFTVCSAVIQHYFPNY